MMKNRMHSSVLQRWIIVFIAIIALILTGCASFYSIHIRSINNLSSVIAGGTISFQSSGRDIVWEVSSTYDGSGSVENGTFITQNGVLTVSPYESSLILYIIVTSTRDEISNVIQIRVATVTNVNVSSANQEVALGRSTQFRAQVAGTNNPDQKVTWRVSSNASGTGSVTPGTTVNTNGILNVSQNET